MLGKTSLACSLCFHFCFFCITFSVTVQCDRL